MTRLLAICCAAALLAAAVPAGAGEAARPAAPGDFEAPDLDGRPLRLSEIRGTATIVNFWASWCYPCRFEMPLLQKLYDRYRGRGLVVVAVAVDDERQAVVDYVNERGFTFPVLFDARGVSKAAFGAKAVPETYVLDRAGRFVPFTHPRTGETAVLIDDPLVWRSPAVDAWLDGLLGAP